MKLALKILLSLVALLAAQGADLAKSDLLQIRVVAEKASDKTQPMRLEHRTVSGGVSGETLYVEKRVLLSQKDLQSASLVKDPVIASQMIQLQFSPSGAKRFATATRENLHKRLAIIINGRVLSAPVIQGEITGGSATITGNFAPGQAEELVEALNAASKTP